MSAKASQITSLTIVYSIVYSRHRSKKTPKLRITGLLCGEFTGDRKRANITENISISWRQPIVEFIEAWTLNWKCCVSSLNLNTGYCLCSVAPQMKLGSLDGDMIFDYHEIFIVNYMGIYSVFFICMLRKTIFSSFPLVTNIIHMFPTSQLKHTDICNEPMF